MMCIDVFEDSLASYHSLVRVILSYVIIMFDDQIWGYKYRGEMKRKWFVSREWPARK